MSSKEAMTIPEANAVDKELDRRKNMLAWNIKKEKPKAEEIQQANK